MRPGSVPLVALSVGLLVVLAGCSTGFQGTGTPTIDTPTPTPTSTQTAEETGEPGDSGTDASGDGTRDVAPPDPPTDRLGWEDGYWYNESLAVNDTGGLNESELRAVVARTMARVERIREMEFETRVPIDVVSRSEYRERFRNRSNYTREFRLFDNAKFEGLFLVGEDRDSIAVQERNRGTAVKGFYSTRNASIVLVSESDPPTVPGELTLGHELVHAIQDQHFNLSGFQAATRDAFDGQRGLVEGDANYVQQRYRRRCVNGDWECRSAPRDGGGGSGDGGRGGDGGNLHLGVYVLSFSPYSDGPGFVDYHHDRGGWEAVNDLYRRLPASSEQIIYPPRYPGDQPAELAIEDTNRNGWERIRPEPARPNSTRAEYARLGQAALTSMFVYTIFDGYNESELVSRSEFFNRDGNRLNSSDPFDYDIAYTDGWEGDRMHVYRQAGGGTDTAYVWKLSWASPAEAEEFARGYRELLAHWGGQRASEHVWRVEDSPFADAFYLDVNGDTVVVVNAPTRDDLGDVYAGAR